MWTELLFSGWTVPLTPAPPARHHTSLYRKIRESSRGRAVKSATFTLHSIKILYKAWELASKSPVASFFFFLFGEWKNWPTLFVSKVICFGKLSQVFSEKMCVQIREEKRNRYQAGIDTKHTKQNPNKHPGSPTFSTGQEVPGGEGLPLKRAPARYKSLHNKTSSLNNSFTALTVAGFLVSGFVCRGGTESPSSPTWCSLICNLSPGLFTFLSAHLELTFVLTGSLAAASFQEGKTHQVKAPHFWTERHGSGAAL